VPEKAQKKHAFFFDSILFLTCGRHKRPSKEFPLRKSQDKSLFQKEPLQEIKHRMGRKSLDKNAFKSQIFLFSLLFLVLNTSCSLDAFRVDFVGDCTKLCATMFGFPSVVTD
jgi:hypothetical protein